MKKLGKIQLQNALILEEQEMKMIFGGSGGSGGSGAYHWCRINGEDVGPLTSCTDEYCQKLYGSGAKCVVKHED